MIQILRKISTVAFSYNRIHAFDSLLLTELTFYFLKMGHPRPLFRLFSVFFKQTSIQFYNKLMPKMSIQYTALGFEPTTLRSWVSSHNHQTRANHPRKEVKMGPLLVYERGSGSNMQMRKCSIKFQFWRSGRHWRFHPFKIAPHPVDRIFYLFLFPVPAHKINRAYLRLNKALRCVR